MLFPTWGGGGGGGGGLNRDIDIDRSPRVGWEVVLASEPVGGRSQVTELPCLSCFIMYNPPILLVKCISHIVVM